MLCRVVLSNPTPAGVGRGDKEKKTDGWAVASVETLLIATVAISPAKRGDYGNSPFIQVIFGGGLSSSERLKYCFRMPCVEQPRVK